MYRYSPSTRAFCYVGDIGAEDFPEDAVDVTDERHAELMNAHAAGQVIEPGPDGAPVAVVPPPPAPVAPRVVSMAQAQLALLDAGLLNDVEAAIAGITDATERRRAQIEWQTRQTVERDSPLLLMLAGALGLNDEALDALFLAASTL